MCIQYGSLSARTICPVIPMAGDITATASSVFGPLAQQRWEVSEQQTQDETRGLQRASLSPVQNEPSQASKHRPDAQG